jgi:hypothetical protein
MALPDRENLLFELMNVADLSFALFPLFPLFPLKTSVINEKKVHFDDIVCINYIDNLDDIRERNLKKVLWWSVQDFYNFQIEYEFEIMIYLKSTNTNDIRDAMRKLYVNNIYYYYDDDKIL